MQTHEVLNQSTPLEDYNPGAYPVLREALERADAGESLAELDEVGALAGSSEALRWGDLAERNVPRLHTHDRFGNRIDEVEYDPAYHSLMEHATRFGLHGAPWASDDPNAHLVRAAKYSAWITADAGHGCPITMTYAAVPALRADEELAARYTPLLTARGYDPNLAYAPTKPGIIAGMSMTEKQGGSDVRANTIASFALGDYEWLLAFEAEELTRIVDLMRELRDTEARMHVREETPFFTGPRVEVPALIDALP